MILFIILSIILGYIVGSLPTALIIGKLTQGIDIREHGSKNLGATNAGRVLGKKYFFIVMTIDAIKCIIGILISYLLFILFFNNLDSNIYTIGLSCAGTFAMIGHCYPLFANFKGGKGVATALGYLLLTSPLCGLSVVISFLIIVLIKRYISLGSIIGAIVAIIYSWLMYFLFKENYSIMLLGLTNNLGYVIITTIFALVVIIKHKENIHRLINKEEKVFKFKK